MESEADRIRSLDEMSESQTRHHGFARAGMPLVKVVPLEEGDATETRRLGFMSGEIRIPDDFDRMGAEQIASLFAGSDT
jgi:hypothetical protein